MLVLSRRRDEQVCIGDGDLLIKVAVLELRPERVRLGIDAPAHIPVHRSEVFAAIQRQTSSQTEQVPVGSKSRAQVVSARNGHLLLRFETTAAMQAAIARGRVSFIAQEA